ncbi:antitoxin of toxin-antitoxin stability system [Bartonella choladocola]|uniref:Antitoxin of toxin-antitoxin stability system n=1 Tax=Bartonella choladocola TaxID=2750995 RepID=A0A1U9MK18_9HYPH|nr:antitoxin of toxin-antitoxin stability system [Bartonella choladocola]AQT47991.1 hypothetical protein BBC0122_018960 [Bartonella choladocola]
MPSIIETTVYQISELEEPAKEEARSWYRQHGLYDDWFEFVYEDFLAIAKILGLDIKERCHTNRFGHSYCEPQIYFRGFWCQGDGASFCAFYSYQKGSTKAIREYAPKDEVLHDIADELYDLQKRNFFQLHVDITQDSSMYCHENTMQFFLERYSPSYQLCTENAEKEVACIFRRLAKWLYRALEAEYEYQTSDKIIDECLAANEYTFTAEGRRFG